MRSRVLFVSIFLSVVLHSAQAESPVVFADANLKAAVEAALWVSDPTPTDMLALDYLSAYSQGITSLSGLEYAENVNALHLSHNRISSLSALSGMSNLETLALNTNEVSDLSPLSGLDHLTSLNLHDNQISDVSPLSGLSNLEELILRINFISDISALSGLTNLDSLTLDSNKIGSISALSGMSKLRFLRIGSNEISDLSPLSGMSDLEYLDAHKNEISNLSALGSLSNLDTLVLSDNQISDISPIGDFLSLSRLDLRDNPLNQEAYDIYLPQIAVNNPGIYLKYDPPVVGQRRLSTSSGAGGSVVSPGEGEFTYADDESVRLEAIAEAGFVFVGWSGTLSGTQNPLFITMDGDYEMRADFRSVVQELHVDDDAPGDPWPRDATLSDPDEDGTAAHPFDRIQEAIEVASEGASIVVQTGTYQENIDLLGKNLTLLGIDPATTTAAPFPVIEAARMGPVVTFSSGEGPDCLLMGFVITRGQGQPTGAILCEGASPTIANCLIVGNRSTDPNGAAVYCRNSGAILTNCTITDNYAGTQGAALALIDSDVTVANSILWGNTPSDIHSDGNSVPSITYSDIGGWWLDSGNLNTDPLFALRGFWMNPDDPNEVLGPDAPGATWIDGDYHLQSQAGQWSPKAQDWVEGDVTSPCIDAGLPTNPLGSEPAPNGDRINMGAYGGTTQASKSHLKMGSP